MKKYIFFICITLLTSEAKAINNMDAKKKVVKKKVDTIEKSEKTEKNELKKVVKKLSLLSQGKLRHESRLAQIEKSFYALQSYSERLEQLIFEADAELVKQEAFNSQEIQKLRSKFGLPPEKWNRG